MKNKVLIQLIVPDLEESYDVFIPINKTVGNIILLLVKSVRELTGQEQVKDSSSLFDRNTGTRYDPSKLILDTNIRNGSQLILM